MSADLTTEVEQNVIGTVLVGADPRDTGLSASHFSGEHVTIWEAITACAGAGVRCDALTVCEQLEASGKSWDGALGYLADLQSAMPTSANVEVYARIVRAKAAKRSAMAALTRAQRMLADGGDPAAALASAQAALLDDGTDRTVTIGTATGMALAEAEAAMHASAAGKSSAVLTGIPFIDQRTGGISPGRVWIVAGRPGAGKSAFVLQALVHAARRGTRAGIVSMEMPAEELAARAIAQTAGLSATALMRGDPQTYARAASAGVVDLMAGMPLEIDCKSHHVGDVCQAIARWKRAGAEVVAVDYLQRISGGEGKTRNEQIGDVTARIKRLALDLRIGVILVAALNRGADRDSRRPGLADLRESGDIEYDADTVIALHRLDFDDLPEYRVEVGVLKQRQGRVGWCAAPLMFIGPQQKFRETIGVPA